MTEFNGRNSDKGKESEERSEKSIRVEKRNASVQDFNRFHYNDLFCCQNHTEYENANEYIKTARA
jgi:hypothetical protein